MPRKTARNPLGLRLGQKVQVKKSALFGYERGEKKLFKLESRKTPFYIVGVARKAIGKYVRPKQFYDDTDSCDDGPRLKVTKWYWVYELRENIEETYTIMALAEDITPWTKMK